MHRNYLLHLLEKYTTQFERDQKMLDQVLEFVKREPECFSRDCLEGHITGSAFVINEERTHALLMHHKKLKWETLTERK